MPPSASPSANSAIGHLPCKTESLPLRSSGWWAGHGSKGVLWAPVGPHRLSRGLSSSTPTGRGTVSRPQPQLWECPPRLPCPFRSALLPTPGASQGKPETRGAGLLCQALPQETQLRAEHGSLLPSGSCCSPRQELTPACSLGITRHRPH